MENGEECELQWSPSGKAVMAFVETEVDETGVSYYGSTRLVLLPLNKGADSVELNSAPALTDGIGANGKNHYCIINIIARVHFSSLELHFRSKFI